MGRKITYQSKYSVWMKPPYSGNGCLERTFIHKEAKSVPGFRVCVSTLYDIWMMTKSPNDAFLRTYPHRQAMHDSVCVCVCVCVRACARAQGISLTTKQHFFSNFTTNEDIATKFEADLPNCVRNVKEKNVLLFKFRCSISIGVRIIKEMLGLVPSGAPCIIV
jgi:hypothetical protein